MYGVVVEGQSSVDESLMIGESLPVERRMVGDATGGTVDLNGMLQITAERVGEDMVLAGIIQIATEAQASKAKVRVW